MKKSESQSKTPEQAAISEALDQLKRAVDILREMGLEVIDRFVTEERLKSEMPFPIVRDGLDGIRAVYSRRSGLKIWFTNGFENPNDPKREKIEQRLKEAGLI